MINSNELPIEQQRILAAYRDACIAQVTLEQTLLTHLAGLNDKALVALTRQMHDIRESVTGGAGLSPRDVLAYTTLKNLRDQSRQRARGKAA